MSPRRHVLENESPVLGGGANSNGRCLDHEGSTLMNELVLIIKGLEAAGRCGLVVFLFFVFNGKNWPRITYFYRYIYSSDEGPSGPAPCFLDKGRLLRIQS